MWFRMRDFLEENWFKIAIVVLGAYAIFTVPSAYVERQLWANERLEAFNRCVDKLTDDMAILTLNESFRAGFRDCKNLSENF